MKLTYKTGLLATSLTFALILAGCSDDSDDSPVTQSVSSSSNDSDDIPAEQSASGSSSDNDDSPAAQSATSFPQTP